MIKNWSFVPLENLVTKVGSGSTPKGGETVYKSEGIPLIRSMNVVFFGFKNAGLVFLDSKQADGLKNAEVKALDILLNITGASIGRVTLAPKSLEGARVNQHVCIIRPNEALEPRFLNAYFSSPAMQSRIWADNYGVTRQALTKQQILEFEIPLAPLPEQKRIADKLDATLARVDACRERLARVGPILKRFRQSVLAAAVSGRLTADWRAQQASNDSPPASTGHPTATTEPASGNPAHTGSPDVAQRNPGNSAASPSRINSDSGADTLLSGIRARSASEQLNLIRKERQAAIGKPKAPVEHLKEETFEIPEGWVWTSLDSLASKIVDGTHHTPIYTENGICFISVKDIKNGKIDFRNTKYISSAEHAELFKRCNPEFGDLLITKSGTIGRTAIVKTQQPFSLFVSVALVKPASRLVNINYIDFALQAWINSIDVSSRVVGTAIKNLHLQDMRVLAIPFPTLEEQREIVRRVESLFAFADRLEARLQAAQTAAEQLTPALLAKAFRGELVPQDPADEPASELLKRLAASRASAEKPKRSRTPRQPA